MIRSTAGLTLLVLAFASPAIAGTGGASPTVAPGAVQSAPTVTTTSSTPSRTGGTLYGKHFATPRPISTVFSVSPRAVRAGSTPHIVLRVDEFHVHHVELKITFVALTGAGSTFDVVVGRKPTWRRLVIAWPDHTALVAGRYRVVLHATGPHGLKLARRPHRPGQTTLTVTPKPKPVVVTPTMPTIPTTPVVTTPPGTVGTFPVAGQHSYGDGIGAQRKGHTHQGQDVLAAFGTPVVAPLAGTIDTTGYQASAAGFYVVENADDGHAYFFAHCAHGTVSVTPGQAVSQGQELCHVGQTGDATAPHLHFEEWVGGWRVDKHSQFIDPLPQLEAWDR